ncbi:MAG: hypothetical protein ACFNTM_00255 [Cardiobacterium sp.]
MSEKQRLETTGKLHFPLRFVLPASFTELGEMMNELKAAMALCPGDWILCFLGMDFDLYEGNMRIHFSLFTRSIERVNNEIPSIEIYISDNGMNAIYPVECYDPVIVDMMIGTFVFYVNKLQGNIKAACHV